MGKIGSYLLAKSLRANLAALLFMLLPMPVPGTAIAAIILGMITLQRGALSGLVVLSWVALPAIAASLKWQLLATHYDLSFIVCTLTWLAATMLRYRYNWSRIIEIATLVGLFYVFSLFLLPENILNYLIKNLEQTMGNALKQVVSLDFAVVQAVIHDKIVFLLGALYFVLCFIAFVYLIFARAWQLSINHAGKNWREFYHIRASRWFGLLAILLIAAEVFWNNSWLQAAAFITTLPFLLSGFSVLIHLCSTNNTEKKLIRIALLLLASAIALLMPAIAFVLLALLGFSDVWINFRQLTLLRFKHRSEIKPKRTSS